MLVSRQPTPRQASRQLAQRWKLTTCMCHVPNVEGGAVAFSHDGQQIAVSGRFKDEPIKIFDTGTFKHILTISLELSEYAVTELEFSPTDESVVIES